MREIDPNQNTLVFSQPNVRFCDKFARTRTAENVSADVGFGGPVESHTHFDMRSGGAGLM